MEHAMEGMKIIKKTRKKFKDKVKELVNTKAKDLWVSFKDGVLRACKELCGKNEGGSEDAHGGGMRKCKKQ